MHYAWAALSLSLLCSVELLELHGGDGRLRWINTAEISALRQPTAHELARYFPKGTRCIVTATNGKFLAVTETCAAIRDRLLNDRPR